MLAIKEKNKLKDRFEKITSLRKEFKNISGKNWANYKSEPNIDYVFWLEQKLIFDKEDKETKEYNCSVCEDQKILEGGIVEEFPCPSCLGHI